MPIKVKCLKCNGTGKIETLFLTEPHWRFLPCPDCKGKGHHLELTFQEKKAKESQAINPDPPPPP